MDEELTIQVDLQKVLQYINTEEFINYIFNTADMSTGLFISHVLNKTINYMLTDENLQV